jgi:hypothetical protein
LREIHDAAERERVFIIDFSTNNSAAHKNKMKTSFIEGSGICGISIDLNIREMHVLADAKETLEQGLELRKQHKQAEDEYGKIRWNKEYTEEQKKAASDKETETGRAVNDHQADEMTAYETFFGFVSKILEQYPTSEKCGFLPRKLR